MRALAGVLVCLCLVAPASAQQLRLTVERLEHPAFSARDLRLQLAGKGAEASIAELRVAGREYRAVRLSCGEARWSDTVLECRDGRLRLDGGEPLPLSIRYDRASGRVEAGLDAAPLATLARLLPGLAAWKFGGRGTASLAFDSGLLTAQVQLMDASFSDASGNRAGEHLAATLEASVRQDGDAWNWQARLQWRGGDVFWQPLFLKGDGQTVSARGRYAGELLSVETGDAALGGLGHLAFDLVWNRGAGRLDRGAVEATGIDLATAVPTLVQPWLDQAALPRLKAGGRAGFRLEYAGGAIQSAAVNLADASLADEDAQGRTRFSLDGVNADLPWRRDAPTEGRFGAAGGALERLPLGRFAMTLAMNGFDVTMPRVAIPVLDGRLLFEDFTARREGDTWQWRLAAALEPVSMPRLTAQVGLPRMNGLLSADIPRIGYAGGTLSLDGALVVSVFDGYLSATGLKVVDPLGRAPRLEADLELRHLDLGMLTETFSFGDMTGYLDADVRGLELVNWRPQQFRARLYSSPGDYPKRISQRAVQDISSIGGAGAAAAIQSSFLSFFKTFGYDRIGLSCVLANGICTMDGIEPAPQGYVIIKGGGVPALSVIGYNRQVQWDELVNRIQAAVNGHGRPVIR